MKIQDDKLMLGLYSDEAALAIDFALDEAWSSVFEHSQLQEWTRRGEDKELYLKIQTNHYYDILGIVPGEELPDEDMDRLADLHESLVEDLVDNLKWCLGHMSLLDKIRHFRVWKDIRTLSKFWPRCSYLVPKRLVGEPCIDAFYNCGMELMEEEYGKLYKEVYFEDCIQEKDSLDIPLKIDRMQQIKSKYESMKYGGKRA